MNSLNYKNIIMGAALVLGQAACTNLDDVVKGKPVDKASTAGGPITGDAAASLQSTYARLNDFATAQGQTYAMEEHPSDEMMGPTRGTDWDDFGTWRKLHQHTWDATHPEIIPAWDNLNNGEFRAIQTIYFAGANAQIKAEASFLKAFYGFYIVDLFGQLPYSAATDDPLADPKLSTRVQAVDTLIKDLDYAVATLPAGSPLTAGKATKAAAEFLLAKIYLNKAVYKQDPTKPAGPYVFDKADMDKVIENCNAIINSGAYQLTAQGKYFDNFHWENSTRSQELIFVIPNTEGSPIANVNSRYHMTMHYFQKPSGWNGFTTLSDFYSSFEQQDERIGGPLPGLTDKIGLRTGFLIGQQYDENGVKLKTRSGGDLVFAPDVNIFFASEEKGIRVIKYFPEPGTNIDATGADYVFFRYADVLLMKAEAIARGGTDAMGATAATLVNELRSTRGASTLGSVDQTALLAERGRELYWEGWRRNDQIRFGTFLHPVEQRTNESPDFRVVFPIPQKTIDTNPSWKQNFGY